MIRLCNMYGDRYGLKDTETQKYLCECEVWSRINRIEIWCVKTFEEFQRKGYATIMLQRVIKKYRSCEKPLLLYVYKDNHIAIHLYEKLGFEIIGEYDGAVDAWTMQYKPKR